jgi:BCD family chlorophyll transporter-like MFS transporter
MTPAPLSWIGIVRLGLVQSAIGAMFALSSLTLNRVMVVEFGMPAILPAAFVAWNYVVQLSRPRWGHGSDVGGRRTPWIIGGMGVMALGCILAADATTMMARSPVAGAITALVAYTMLGAGVGAAGTSLLALLATRVAPLRRPAAAAVTWIMMIVGFIIYAAVSGALLQPFSARRLALVASGVAGVSFLTALVAIRGAERGVARHEEADLASAHPAPSLRTAIAEIWADPVARQFTVFVFVSMLAYSAQELILEPFAGLVFDMTPAQSAQLTGLEKGGALLGMIVCGALGSRLGPGRRTGMAYWTIAGCVGSALALVCLAAACVVGPAWPLTPTVFVLGFANGVFAVSAIGSMMGLAGAAGTARAGGRMGLWGGAQAAGFAIGGFFGAVGVEGLRGLLHETGMAFMLVFGLEAAGFLVAAAMAARLDVRPFRPSGATDIPATEIGFGGVHQ